MAKNRDIEGNAVASALAVQRAMLNLAEQLLRFESIAERLWDEGVYLVGMSVKLPDGERSEYLVVVRARNDSGSVVGFVASDTLGDVLRRTVASLENGSIKWKEDQYG